MARGSPCCTRALRMRLPSSIVSCSHKKKDSDPIVGRIRFVRTTMRKEVVLECHATARTFEGVLEKVLCTFCLNHLKFFAVIVFFAGETIRNIICKCKFLRDSPLVQPASVFIEEPSSWCSNTRCVGRTTWTRASVFLVRVPIQEA